MEQTQVPAQPPVQSAFRSRRSYPSLHHVSLAPLNPRFLADEEGEEAEVPDYFNHPHHNHHDSPDPPTARSYLASFSVPGTPGVLSHSHSRSGSRTRHHPRSKSSSRIHHASDPNLQARSASSPLHHHHQQQQHQPHQTHHANRSARTRHPANHHQDTEWMLRAGIALASSTREEKGQSWLVKRQSSTSLVSDNHQLSLDFLNHNHNHHHHHSWCHGGSPRHGRSGRSTPAAANSRSRRASRSRPSSRVASRADLAMTSLGMATTATSTAASSRRGSRTADLLTSTSTSTNTSTNTSTQKIEEQQQQQQTRPLIPDFVDERIRAEMASIQRDENAEFDDEEEEVDDDLSSFTSDYPYLDSGDESDEIDEQELQRLTRERGFGLGSWIDRMVEWTLFGVEDWPLSFGGGGGGTDNDGTVVESRTITVADHPPHPSADNVEDDPSSTHVAVAATPSIGADDTDAISLAESEALSVCEKPGDQGGWGDAGWLFRAVKRALY
ncbi:hypothetical protein ASPACDRAFT_39391 [Aspergillus aculeatus ATCC 16872]|uniref:Uncharacterized protein n=1 Tax=Aspergillus aculeatus (strain ATCC 16872 / CBS 172.66 / WB 5094) TaxID=690307 RepID=A0A1L9X5Q6_ASPA1|nr:uncharacterized protein ASPACDRAFT_39391 [Aspergillus aculeatus ATCC 16872]OJK03770.1 hypothetical protein ASPACDRAFT_39391 [Aspergillus aculeatus ATCC 16872]